MAAPGAAWLDQRRKDRIGPSAQREQAVEVGTGNPGKSRSLVRSGDELDPTQVFEFVSANQAVYPIRSVSRVLGVSPSGFYAWRKRPPSKREQADDMLTQEIKKIHQKSKGTYGAPRIHAELAEQGWHGGRKRVARLMKAADLRGVSRRKAPRTTQRQAGATPAPIWSSVTSQPVARMNSGSPTLHTSQPGPGSCIWPSCSMPGAAGSSAGP